MVLSLIARLISTKYLSSSYYQLYISYSLLYPLFSFLKFHPSYSQVQINLNLHIFISLKNLNLHYSHPNNPTLNLYYISFSYSNFLYFSHLIYSIMLSMLTYLFGRINRVVKNNLKF